MRPVPESVAVDGGVLRADAAEKPPKVSPARANPLYGGQPELREKQAAGDQEQRAKQDAGDEFEFTVHGLAARAV